MIQQKSPFFYILIGLILVSISMISFLSCSSKKGLKDQTDRLLQAKISDFEKLEVENLAYFQNRSEKPTEVRNLLAQCNNIENYRHDSPSAMVDIKRTIRVNVHFINSLDSTENFNADTGIKYAKGLIRYANGKLQDNRKMKLPEGNNTPVHPIPFRYKLVGDPTIPGDEGVYFHYQENPFYLNYGKIRNNYDRKIIEKYAVNMDSVLNIFYMVHPQDSVNSRIYKMKEGGIALGNAVKLGVDAKKKTNEWTYSSLLNHEIGHVFGLSHAWIKNDGCEDTPANDNCWNSGPAPCDGIISNNVMDYNSNQNSYSPCQIGKMNRNLSRISSSVRDLAIPTWCKHDPSKDLIIKDTMHWNRHVDYNGNITIAEGGRLLLSCHLNMAASTGLIIEPGGELILAKATIYNDCNDQWKGIKIKSSNGILGKLRYIDTFHIMNIDSSKFYSIDN